MDETHARKHDATCTDLACQHNSMSCNFLQKRYRLHPSKGKHAPMVDTCECHRHLGGMLTLDDAMLASARNGLVVVPWARRLGLCT